LDTFAYRLPDNAITISKIGDLQRQLDDINAIRAAIQGQLGSWSEYGVYTRDDLNALTAVVNGKQETLDTASAIDVASVSADVTVSGEVRTTSLFVHEATTANLITASTINVINMVAEVGAFTKFSSNLIGDNGSTLYFAYGDPFAIRFGKYAARVGINTDCSQASGLALDCIGAARFSKSVTTAALSAGATQIHSGADEIPFLCGNDDSYLRIKFGRHIDSYDRADGSGRDLNLCVHTGSAVRVGARLSIATSPSSSYNLDVGGTGRFSGALSASNFPSNSDARIKTGVVAVSLDECSRLVKAIMPCTYRRKDMEGTPERCGYIAQDWDRELSGGFRCIMGAGEDADGPLLALDYSRIVPILHGALLAALARLDALESRLQ
jgi:hypothetical protein